MNELSGQDNTLSDAEVITLGFCPHCHCSESTVTTTRKVHCSTIRGGRGARRRVRVMKILRYRKCSNCGKPFRTTEESESTG